MIAKTDLLTIYEMMQRIRKFEYKAYDLQMKGYMGGAIHLSIGQEAIPATIGRLLENDDYICSTHRGHGHLLGKGADPNRALAEVLGKAGGYCKGRGGSMHIADPAIGILGTNGIVGGGIPCAVGAGFSIKYRRTAQVSVAYFGDGAANEGSFHESMNMAAVWNLPVLFACENNLYGMSAPIAETTKETSLYKRAAGYGIYGAQVDGNDVLAVWDAAEEALGRARDPDAECRPSLLEFRTYRWRGHFEGDPMEYRPKGELEKWTPLDPIARLENKLVSEWGVSAQELKAIRDAVDREIAAAEKFALDSPYPDPATVMDGLFTETDGFLTETDGLFTETDGLFTETDGLLTETDGLFTETDGLLTETDGLFTETDGLLGGQEAGV